MARVIPFDQLRPGMTVWEDWRLGTECLMMEVIAKLQNGAVEVVWRDERGYGPGGQTEGRTWLRPNREYRYWNQEPTMEERQFTPWTEGGETN